MPVLRVEILAGEKEGVGMKNNASVGTSLRKLISSEDPESISIDFILNLLNRKELPYTIREGYIKGPSKTDLKRNLEKYNKFLEERKEKYQNDELFKKYVLTTSKERYYCIKTKCKKRSNVTTILNCLVCGKEFGVEANKVGSAKYCSRECQHISMTKDWREKSPYAKRIKKIKKRLSGVQP